MRGANGRRIRSKQRAPAERDRRAGRSAAPARIAGATTKALAMAALSIASACNDVVTGLELCVRRTHDDTVAVAAKSASEFVRTLLDSTIDMAAAYGVDAHPRTRTGDRLRWEWLASTATLCEGSPDRQLLEECARILAGTIAASRVTDLGEEIAARLRLASAEAHSLARATRGRATHADRHAAVALPFET